LSSNDLCVVVVVCLFFEGDANGGERKESGVRISKRKLERKREEKELSWNFSHQSLASNA
jgi:hypothetical protein